MTIRFSTETMLVAVASGLALVIAMAHLWGSKAYSDERMIGFFYGVGALFGTGLGVSMAFRQQITDAELYGILDIFVAFGLIATSIAALYHVAFKEVFFAALNLTLAFLCLSTFATLIAYALDREKDRALSQGFASVGSFIGWVSIIPGAITAVLLVVAGIKALIREIKSA